MKRGFDIIVSLFCLLIFMPPLLVICMCVAFSSGMPVLFRHERVGQNGRAIIVLKFRTMAHSKDLENGGFDAGNVARVTTVGRWLRRSKLDELPQLWNVLKGDMSIVGPRPEVRRWVDEYPEHWAEVLTVRPGITDPASIRFRNEEDILSGSKDPILLYRRVILPQKLEFYKIYVREHSLIGDVKLIYSTILVIFRGCSRSP